MGDVVARTACSACGTYHGLSLGGAGCDGGYHRPVPGDPGCAERLALREHIRACRTCTVVQLRAVFGARPFIDTSAAASHLDDMCDEGKRLAAATQSAPSGQHQEKGERG